MYDPLVKYIRNTLMKPILDTLKNKTKEEQAQGVTQMIAEIRDHPPVNSFTGEDRFMLATKSLALLSQACAEEAEYCSSISHGAAQGVVYFESLIKNQADEVKRNTTLAATAPSAYLAAQYLEVVESHAVKVTEYQQSLLNEKAKAEAANTTAKAFYDGANVNVPVHGPYAEPQARQGLYNTINELTKITNSAQQVSQNIIEINGALLQARQAVYDKKYAEETQRRAQELARRENEERLAMQEQMQRQQAAEVALHEAEERTQRAALELQQEEARLAENRTRLQGIQAQISAAERIVRENIQEIQREMASINSLENQQRLNAQAKQDGTVIASTVILNTERVAINFNDYPKDSKERELLLHAVAGGARRFLPFLPESKETAHMAKMIKDFSEKTIPQLQSKNNLSYDDIAPVFMQLSKEKSQQVAARLERLGLLKNANRKEDKHSRNSSASTFTI